MPSRKKAAAADTGDDSDNENSSSPTRVKSTTKTSDLLKLVPQLDEVGYDKWLKSIQLVAYTEEWYDIYDDVFVDEGWEPSNFDDELVDARSKSHRKMCFTLIIKTCIANEHLFEDVKLGDVKDAYDRIVRVYNRQTTAGYIDAQVKFTGSNMHGDQVDLG